MWKNLVFACFLAVWGFACNNTSGQTHDHEEEGATETTLAGDGVHFGETITAEGAITYEALLAQMAETDSIPAKVMGSTGSVCQVKGCWMDLVSNSEGNPPMRVSFKDYGFFVPKDITGRTVVLDGYAYRSVTSVDDLRHFAEDEGLSKEEIEQITEPQEEIKFLASGVLLINEGTDKQ
ncbi:MAG: DUF4920 domain-containing protein [Saprospirales bacterium]|nr:DUF4920 domain-containing protein [Saprospirales bacterium]